MTQAPHRTRRRMSVRTQLLVDTVIASALVATLVIINASNGFESARASAVTQVTAETASQAQGLRDTVETVPGYLASVVSQPGVRALDATSCAAALRNLGTLSAGAHILIVDRAGRIACSDGSLGRMSSIGASDWLGHTFAAGTSVAGPVADPTSQRTDVVFSIAFRSSAGRELALVGMAATAMLIPLTAHNRVDPMLVDAATGTVIDAPTELPGLIGSTVDRGVLQRLISRQTTASLVGADGVKRITAARSVVGTKWVMLGGLSENVAMAPARHDLNRNLAIGALIVAVLLALGYLMHRRITRPLHILRRAMARVGADNVGTRVPANGPTEFRVLATAFNEMLDARARIEARFRSLARYDSDFVTVVNAAGLITYANPRTVQAFEVDLEHGAPVPFVELVDPNDSNYVAHLMRDWLEAPPSTDSRAEFGLRTSTGEIRYVEANVQNLIADPSVEGLIITCGDITERKAAEDRLTHAALHDSLTGLPNLPLVIDRLEHVLDRSRRDHALSAVLFLDLDSFKLINDTAGHGTGDALLVQVAERLSALVRPGDTLGRLGGDEFIVICEGLASNEDASVIATRLIETRTEPYVVNGQEIYIGGSIGIAIARPEDTASGLLRDADVAMYRAKAAGRGSVCVFDEAMRVATHNRLDIENALQRAIERAELRVHYQPLIALDDDRPVCLEALLRWVTSDGTTICPDQFIPIAEETGLIVPIGAWVLDEGCRQLARWTETGVLATDVALAVNVSARQLIQPGFPSTVAAALDRHGVAPGRLVIEITESTVMHDAIGSIACLSELRALGVRISVDDFGTGYSSLGYLQRLPIDELKIDRAFVSPLSTGERAASIVESIVSLGHALGLTVIAEGVESVEQLRRLRAIGCDVAQGFLYTRPLPAELVPDWLRGDHRFPGATARPRSRRTSGSPVSGH
jgi:diguanylate cyclase (GGDEF)-like protein/PAS domain S-box-containing protein